MVLHTMVTGKRVLLKARASLITRMATSMMVSGRTINALAMVNMSIKMVQPTLGCGRTTYRMARAQKYGLKVPDMKELTKMAKSKDLGSIHGLTALFTLATGSIIKSTESVNTCGKMVESTTVNGKRMTCLAMEFTSTTMV